jgi:hypothetical protein
MIRKIGKNKELGGGGDDDNVVLLDSVNSWY